MLQHETLSPNPAATVQMLRKLALRRVEIRFDVVLSYSPTKQYSQFAVSGDLTMSKLLEEVRDLIRTLHYSYRTEEAYLNWIRQYILFHGKRHPTEMGAAEVSASLTHLAVRLRPQLRIRRSRAVSASRIKEHSRQAVSKLLTLFERNPPHMSDAGYTSS